MSHVITVSETGLIRVDGEWPMRMDGYQVPVHFTAQERQFFVAVMTAKRGCPRSLLLAVLYPNGEEADGNIIEVICSKVRRKLGVHRGAIETIKGQGYCRAPDYTYDAPDLNMVPVLVDAKLVEDITVASETPAAEVVDRLLRKELDALWQPQRTA